MVEYVVSNYGLFLLKIITILGAILILIAIINKSKETTNKGSIKVTNLSEQFDEQQYEIQSEILNDDEFKTLEKDYKAKLKSAKVSDVVKKKLFILEFIGNELADEVENLREEITAVLSVAKANDEVLLKLESPGGTINGYGLAAAQLQRLKKNNIKLTIAVDQIAASGGYMMACVADKIVGAPFSIIGSIGVVAEFPNIHKLLKKHDIDYDVMTAGEFKRTITIAGENTEKGKQKFQEELEEVFDYFKLFISENRPKLNVESVATGEYWYGQKALELNLIDEIKTSDELILEALNEKDVFEIKYEKKKNIIKNIGIQAEKSLQNITLKLLNSNRKDMMK